MEMNKKAKKSIAFKGVSNIVDQLLEINVVFLIVTFTSQYALNKYDLSYRQLPVITAAKLFLFYGSRKAPLNVRRDDVLC